MDVTPAMVTQETVAAEVRAWRLRGLAEDTTIYARRCAIARLAEWLKCYHEEVMPIAASNCPRTRLQVRDVPSGTLVDVPRPGTAMNLTGAGPGHFRSIEDATAADLLAWRTALTVSPGFTLRPGLCGVARSIARMRGPGGRRRMVDSVLWRCAGCGTEFIGQRTPDDLCTACIAAALARPAAHWAYGRCWCSRFHRDQVETLELIAPPVVPGVPQFELAAQERASAPTLAGLYRDIIDTAGTPLMHVMVHAAAKLIGEGRFDGPREVPRSQDR